ncbi:hypothetical protein V8D89_011155 [Ganoderma adspersum]
MVTRPSGPVVYFCYLFFPSCISSQYVCLLKLGLGPHSELYTHRVEATTHNAKLRRITRSLFNDDTADITRGSNDTYT